MQRDEALSFLKQLLSDEPNFSPNAIQLNNIRGSGVLEIHIKEQFYTQIIKDVAQKLNLSCKEKENEIMIYKP